MQSVPTQTSKVFSSGSSKFSHRLHFERTKVTCDGCHASARTSQQASDNNLPEAENCQICHGGFKAPGIRQAAASRKPLRKIRFNHQQHLELGNIAPALVAAMDSGAYLASSAKIRRELDTENECVACHRGLTASKRPGMTHLPQMADCLVCHSHIEPPFSCELCHTEDAVIKPQSHTPNYVDVHSSPTARLDKVSCKICHGTNFRCMGCH